MYCQMFEFRHLPEPGGIFQQHPGLLERFMYILQEQEKHRKDEEARRSRNRGGSTIKPPRGKASPRGLR